MTVWPWQHVGRGQQQAQHQAQSAAHLQLSPCDAQLDIPFPEVPHARLLCRLVGKALKYPLLDTDALIEKGTKKKISKIFQEEGEEGFRDLETGVLKVSLPLRNTWGMVRLSPAHSTDPPMTVKSHQASSTAVLGHLAGGTGLLKQHCSLGSALAALLLQHAPHYMSHPVLVHWCCARRVTGGVLMSSSLMSATPAVS